MNKLITKLAHLYLFQVTPLQPASELSSMSASPTAIHADITNILNSYSSVFTDPNTLSPSRHTFDHRIPLTENTKPINLRPYRYSLQQKDVIEKLTQELLDQGVIRDSNNPFASPVVLVQKKDGGWHVY